MQDFSAVSWELVPYSFITTRWHFDADYGWLEFCPVKESFVKRAFLHRLLDTTLCQVGQLMQTGGRLLAQRFASGTHLENERW